jgi:hypothetical protein
VRQALHLYLHLFAAPMEKSLQLSRLADLSNVWGVNRVDFMPQPLLLQLSA